MAATANAVGSWFPSGYYGHFRSKSRNDFMCEFRQLAKPQPPKKFIQRSRLYTTQGKPTEPAAKQSGQPTPKHVFSHHDNRESFLTDALYFEQGLGRKRVPNETYNFKPDFITWMPEREYVQRSRPLTSSYRYEFKQKPILRQKPIKISTGVGTSVVIPDNTEQKQAEPVPQLIVKRPKTSFDGVPTTSYRYAHGDINPNKQLINAMNNDALQLSLLNRKNRAMSAKVSSGRESVASCLVWYNPEYEKKVEEAMKPKSTVPAATQTTVYAPHPPPPRQPAHNECVTKVPQPQVVLNNTAPPVPEAAPPVVMETVQSLPPAPVQETANKPTSISWAPPQQVAPTAPPIEVPPVQ